MDLMQLVQDVHDGNESGLVALAVLKEQKAIVEKCIKEVEGAAHDEAAAYTEKTFTFKDLQVEKRAGGKQFDFKAIPEWIDAKAALTAVENKAKAVYNSYENGVGSVDTETGEIPMMPKVTYRKDSLIIKRIEL